MQKVTEFHFGPYTTYSAEQVCQELHTDSANGLSADNVIQRLKKYGHNELPEQKNSWWRILLSQFMSPFIYLLLAIVGVTFLLGDFHSTVVIAACVLLNTIVGFYQEYKADRSLKLLKQYLIAKVTVMRDGEEQEVPSATLVPGDILLLYPGDVIPADVRFIQAEHLQVDESVMTGESGPVQKQSAPLAQQPQQLFHATNIGLSGTTIVSGKAVGVVIATGLQGTLGAIATLTGQTQRISGFALEITRFSHFILYIIIGTTGLVFITHLLIGHGQLSIINLAIFAVSLGVTMVPEALPVVTLFGFTRGALLLAQHKVVVKRLSAIEDLGSMEVLCTDKTGTLTENKLTIAAVYGPERDVLFWGTLGSGLSLRNLSVSKGFDAVLWAALTDDERRRLQEYEKIGEIPFDPERRRSLALYKHAHTYELIVRGAPEDVLGCCVATEQLKKRELEEWLHQEGKKGNRVIAVVKKDYAHINEAEIDTKAEEHSMALIGFIAFEDPLKITARSAIDKAQKLGLQIKILSGDTPEVCAAIAGKVGLIQNPAQVVSGEYFAQQSHHEKEKLVEHGIAFARVTPQQKYEIVQLLQDTYQVGYMGDGINDAPALKIAHVALAVDDAADIARNAADIILLHRSLRVIVNGVEEGRIIFANTIKYLTITLAAGFGHFYALAIASLLIDFLPMLPVQLLVLNFMTDVPLIALSTDTITASEIKSPQKYDIKAIIIVATVLGLVITTFDFILFGLFHNWSPAVLQTNWFISCMFNELVFALSARSTLPFYKAQLPSKTLMFLSALVAVITVLLPFTNFGHTWLHFVSPSGRDLLIIFALALGCFITTECVKALYYTLYKNSRTKIKIS